MTWGDGIDTIPSLIEVMRPNERRSGSIVEGIGRKDGSLRSVVETRVFSSFTRMAPAGIVTVSDARLPVLEKLSRSKFLKYSTTSGTCLFVNNRPVSP